MAQGGRPRNQKKHKGAVYTTVPLTVVGAALVAAMMVLLLLSKSQLSQLGFEITALEQELEELESRRDKLLIAQTEAYGLERVERYAKEVLGMVHPNPDQYRMIDIE
ncbi:MAG: cell division protein FtsL [Oscillospiraceae bacterium]|nr:cell division protein FtsL [Oscillospiraceae bacterium]